LCALPGLLPTTEILPPEDWQAIDDALDRIHQFDWLMFTSVNGVRYLLNRLWETNGDIRRLGGVKIAAIGTSTADALAEFHVKADLIPESFRAEALAAELAPLVNGKRVLWARASRGRDVLPTDLTAAGATVEQLVVYRNVDVSQLPNSTMQLIENGQLNWIGLSSPSIAKSLKALITPAAEAQLGKSVFLASISPVTSAAAREVGLPIHAEAKIYTWNGIFDAIVASEAGKTV
jgi:uroporphyrinogen III methyltransferase/synthase